MKIIKLLGKLLACFIALAVMIYGIYQLCVLLPPNTDYNFIYWLVLSAINFVVPALIMLCYSLLVYAVLKGSRKRILIAFLNGLGIMALFTGVFLLFPSEFFGFMTVVPAICIMSMLLSVVMLALRPKSLPQAETAPETVLEAVPETVPEAAEESK